jgi:uncharacterized membrane protein
VAIVLGIAALLAVLASVDSTARGLKVESIANQVTNETIAVIGERFPMKGEQLLVTKLQDPEATMARLDRRDADAVLVVRSPEAGWVRQIASDALLAAAPAGATIQTLISVGTYVMEETPILSVLDIDVPDDDEAEHMSRELCAAIDFGNERTMQQDVDFGVLRLSDIGLRALSSGVNDPNTAVEIVVRLGSVLRALLGRDLSGEQSDEDGRTLISTAAADYGSYVHAAFDPMREAADNQISVYEAMLRTLGQLVDQAGLIDDAEARESIHEAGAEIFERATKCDLLPRERERLQSVAELAGFVPAR